jgi:hypothetical protein
MAKDGYIAHQSISRTETRPVYLANSEHSFEVLKKQQNHMIFGRIIYVSSKQLSNLFGNNDLCNIKKYRDELTPLVTEHITKISPRCIHLVDMRWNPNPAAGVSFVLDISHSYLNKLFKNKTINTDSSITAKLINDDYEDWSNNNKITDFVDDLMTVITTS